VQLVRALPHLKDLIFNSYNQTPPDPFAALGQCHPDCRLHLPEFRFRSLRRETTDLYEMAVVTSPLLRSIGVRWVRRDSEGHDDYNQEAAMRLIGGLAPKLERVKMMHCRPVSTKKLYLARGPRIPWAGLSNNSAISQEDIVPAALKSLSLIGIPPVTLEGLKTWQNHVSFASLRYLNLTLGAEASMYTPKSAQYPSSLYDFLGFSTRPFQGNLVAACPEVTNLCCDSAMGSFQCLAPEFDRVTNLVPL
jgi:hypothetical protein